MLEVIIEMSYRKKELKEKWKEYWKIKIDEEKEKIEEKAN